ncbi:hypothetical protein TNCV_4386271 [Trichonephila clavipes]|nr:hypothetical protein TNCV_4386271 [Trichonephila clavipes]
MEPVTACGGSLVSDMVTQVSSSLLQPGSKLQRSVANRSGVVSKCDVNKQLLNPDTKSGMVVLILGL